MKQTKKQLSLLLVLVMVLSVFNGYTAKAETNITVTLRVEQDAKTLITPIEVTLTDADKKDYGIGLPTETLTPLHALAKYLTEAKGATDATMKQYIQASESQYGLFLEGISTDGTSSGSPAAGSQDNVSWMFAVNNTAPTTGVSGYELKDHASIVFYGIWSGGIWPDNVETNYSYWDQDSYTATSGKPITVKLNGLGYDDSYNSIIKNIAGASVIAAPYSNQAPDSVVESTASVTGTTDTNGMVSLTFTKAGVYTLSAYRKADDGVHYNISRPYALVTVSDETGATEVPTQAPTLTPTVSPTSSPDVNSIQRTDVITTKKVQAPAKPTRLKVTVKKGKKKNKTVQISWKKAKRAKGYCVNIKTKKKKGYKTNVIYTKKTKIKLKLKKGTYLIRVKAYTYDESKRKIYGTASKILKKNIKE